MRSFLSRLTLSRVASPPLRRSFFNPERDVQWKTELARLGHHLLTLDSDFERTTFLREYTGSLIAIGRPDARAPSLLRTRNLASVELAEIYPLLKSHDLPAECGVTSLFCMKLLRAFGFAAYQYSFGFTEKPFDRFIHSIVLVEIGFRGAKRLILQDPYWNLTYRNEQGSPIDFFAFLAAIRQREYGGILMDPSSVMTSLVITDTSEYFPFLSDACKKVMTEAFKNGDGSTKTKIPIARNYATLMQSPYHHVENAFVNALRLHGFDEPFLYAYTLQAADLVGESERGNLQRRIDAILG
jgi:hypothetical protein